MKKIDLAVLPAGAALTDAYSAMRGRKQSAIVTVRGTRPGVITAQQIIRGIREGKSSVDDLIALRVGKKTEAKAAPIAAPGMGGGYRTMTAPASANRIQLVKIRSAVASVIVDDRLAVAYSAFPAGCR